MSSTQTTASADSKPRAGAVPVRAPQQERPCSCAGGGGECDTCKRKAAEPVLQRKAAGPARTATAPATVNRVLDSPGRPLDAPARSFMEPRFGRDFGGVRIHTDPTAAESARAVDAHAYTVGQHIVFDSGKYDPHSGPGRNLLAHELAHTVQQRGTGPASPVLRLGDTPEYNHLENEASSVAQAVVHRSGAPLSMLATAASGPILSRAAKTQSTTATSPKEEDANDDLKKAGVEKYTLQDDTVLAKMSEAFPVPANKGEVIDKWEAWAAAGKLKATYDWKLGRNANPRENGPDKRALWLKKVHWDADPDPGARWKAAGGDTASFNPPKADKKTCQVDHIVELQIGGENEPDNMQMLDSRPNTSSGGKIRGEISRKAREIEAALYKNSRSTKDPTKVEITYPKVAKGSVDPLAPQPGKCYEVEKKAAGAAAPVAKTTGGIEFPLLAGSSSATMVAATAKESPVKLQAATDPRNKEASALIPGLTLIEWKQNAKNPTDGGTVSAKLDPKPGSKTALPDSLTGGEPFDLKRSPDGKLTLAGKKPRIVAKYKFLSALTIDSLNLEDDGSISGGGTIQPTLTFLPKFQVLFNKTEFRLLVPIPAEKLQKLMPIPGVKIQKGQLELLLGPKFLPSATLDFSLDAPRRQLLKGQLLASADDQGLVFKTTAQLFLPGVKDAAVHILYQGGKWSGGTEIDIIPSKPLKGGHISVSINDQGMSANGTVSLDVPGTGPEGVSATVAYADKKWSIIGKGAVKPPGATKPLDITILYDGDKLHGEADTTFEFHGLNGKIHLVYEDGKFSGTGDINMHRPGGKITGNLHVNMHQAEAGGEPAFSGSGSITYPFTRELVGTAGIAINEKQQVHLTGALEHPKPIKLFDAIKGDYKFFDVGVSLPIPGLAVPGVGGVEVRFDAALSAGYALGPGELVDTKITGDLDPLAENPNLKIKATSTLNIPLNVHVTGSIDALVQLNLAVASIGGGVKLTATAALGAHVSSTATLEYAEGSFGVDVNFEMLAGLALTMALDAVVKAQLGRSVLGVDLSKTWEWDWKLASYSYDTGQQFGLKLKNPIHYQSGQPFSVPFSSIEWVTPTLDPKKMVDKTFAGAGQPAQKEAR